MGSILYDFPGVPENPAPAELLAAATTRPVRNQDGIVADTFFQAQEVVARSRHYQGIYATLAKNGLAVPQQAAPDIARDAMVKHLQAEAGQLVGNFIKADARGVYAGKTPEQQAAYFSSHRPTLVTSPEPASVLIHLSRFLVESLSPEDLAALAPQDRDYLGLLLSVGPVDVLAPKVAEFLGRVFPDEGNKSSAARKLVNETIAKATAPQPGEDEPSDLSVVLGGFPCGPNALTAADIVGALS